MKKENYAKSMLAFFYARGSDPQRDQRRPIDHGNNPVPARNENEAKRSPFCIAPGPTSLDDVQQVSVSEEADSVTIEDSFVVDGLNVQQPPPSFVRAEHAVVAEAINDEEYRQRLQQEIMQGAVQAHIFKTVPFYQTRQCLAITGCIIVAAMMAFVVVFTTPSGRGNHSGQDLSPTGSPTYLSRLEAFHAILLSNQVSVEALVTYNTKSPQFRALKWLAETDGANISTSASLNVIIERYTAAVLFYTTDGMNWKETCGFLSTTPICSWTDTSKRLGIFCNEHNQSTSIQLEGNRLAGSIPSELGKVANLTLLSLARNQLQGPMPTEIGSLHELVHLELTNNTIEGHIPSESGSWSRMTALYLAGNQMRGTMPTELGQLSGLLYLDLAGNMLTGSLPAQIGKLTALQTLALRSNRFKGALPTEIGYLQQLVFLDVSSNDLNSSIPIQMGQMSGLRAISLTKNEFSGTVPTEIGLLKLTTFQAGYNNLKGRIPDQLWNMTSLQQVTSPFNEVSGSLPTTIWTLSNLQVLDLFENALTGTIPEIGLLTQMVRLEVSNQTLMQLRGRIPTEFGLLTNLKELLVWGNSHTGTLPTEIGLLRHLQVLDVSFCKLTGTVPSVIATLPDLELVYFNANNFTGNLTPYFCNSHNRSKPYADFWSTCGTQSCHCCTGCV